MIREGLKNCEKAIRLTAWVDHTPLPRSDQENVKKIRKNIYFWSRLMHTYKCFWSALYQDNLRWQVCDIHLRVISMNDELALNGESVSKEV